MTPLPLVSRHSKEPHLATEVPFCLISALPHWWNICEKAVSHQEISDQVVNNRLMLRSFRGLSHILSDLFYLIRYS